MTLTLIGACKATQNPVSSHFYCMLLFKHVYFYCDCYIFSYLSDQEDDSAGGETSFPKGNCDDFEKEIGCGFKIRPKKGTGAVFYNLLEDGNGL